MLRKLDCPTEVGKIAPVFLNCSHAKRSFLVFPKNFLCYQKKKRIAIVNFIEILYYCFTKARFYKGESN